MRKMGALGIVVLLVSVAIVMGSPDAFGQDAQKRLMARRAARVDALRNLAEMVHGLRIDASTTVEKFITTSDEIKAKLSATIQGAMEIDSRENPDGSVEVTVEIPTELVEKVIGSKLDYDYRTIRATGSGVPPGGAAPAVPPKSEAPVPMKVVRAKGYGVEPGDPNMSQAEKALLGKRAAKVDALRNLTEQVYGVRVTADTLVRNLVADSDEVKAKVNTFIQGARVLSEKRLSDGSYEVELELDLSPLKDVVAR